MPCNQDRRRLFTFVSTAALGVVAIPNWIPSAEGAEKEGEEEVEAVEDLMREHGVLRRALLVYSEAASRLAKGSGVVPAEALGRTATLFRSFGEDYHERSLEEKHIFPTLIKIGGSPAALSRVLADQHERGRQITDYITAVTQTGRISVANVNPLAATLAAFVRMYEHHTAIEDTVIFPAWKAATQKAEYHELSERFEELEHRMFGKDGFEDAVKRIGAIEQTFGLADLEALTAPAPPRPAA